LGFRQKKRLEQEQKLEAARSLLVEGKFDNAASAVKEGLETRLFADNDSRVVKLLDEIRARKKSASGSGSAPSGMGARGDVFPAGTKNDLAKDYVYVRGIEVPKQPAGPAGNTSAAATGISATGPDSQTPSVTGSQSESGISTSGGKVRGFSSAGLSGAALEAVWQDRERQFLTNVEKQLAMYVGPIAAIITGRTAAKAKDPVELLTLLATSLNVEADRKAFLARRSELLRTLIQSVAPELQANSEASKKSPTAQTSTPKTVVALTAEGIRQAGELLARHLGPVSMILAERAAPRAQSEQALYALLAEHLKDPIERATFLRDAGYPQ
jgi:hypothetical protein